MKTLRSLGIAVAAAAAVGAAGMTLALTTPAMAQHVMSDDKIAANNGDIMIHAIHHAALTLTWNGKEIMMDPAPKPGLAQGADPTTEYKSMAKPDAIFITHIHGDHFNVPILETVSGPNTVLITPQNVYDKLPADLKSKAKVMKNGDKMDVVGVPVEAVAMYNTTPARMKYHPKGLGNGYIFTLGGKRIYVAGDTEEAPELMHLQNVEVAFLPMNLPYTETVEQAAKWVKDFHPKIVYPYHYRGNPPTDINEFKKLVGNAADVRFLKWY